MTNARIRAPLADHLLTPQNASPSARTANPPRPRRPPINWTTSPGRHAAAHFRLAGHPVILSYEPSEDWYWWYLDQFVFELQGALSAPSQP